MADDTRIVAVLFVDLVDSTPIQVRLGDDATDRLRRRYFATLRDAITTHNGAEDSSAGDGMVATFEGSAVDAVGCAVAIQRNVVALNDHVSDLDLAVRIGVSIGELAQSDGEWHGLPFTQAARLESAAEPGQILVADLVRSLAGSRGGYRFESVGELQLKGLSEPVAASAVVWQPSADRPSVAMPTPLATLQRGSIVGRADSLAHLAGVWSDCLDGASRGVVVDGESGVGKTRLAASFAGTIRDGIVLFGRGDPDEPWGAFTQALRPVVAAASPEQLREAAGPYVSALTSIVPLARGRLPELGDDDGRAGAEVPAAVVHFLEQMSAVAPVLVVLDDLDRAHPDTLRLLDRLLSVPMRGRILILGLAQDSPELPNADPRRISLAGLTVDAVAELVEELRREGRGGEPPFPPDEIHRRTGGNPRAVIETVEGMLDLDAARPASDAGSRSVVVGRSEPRRRIAAAAAAAEQGRRAAVMVSGSAGMGKTTLIRDAVETVAAGALLGWGTCWHGEGAPAFWPWTQALDDLASAVGPTETARLAGDDRDVLSVLIRELGPAVESHADPERHRLLLLEASVRWLEALATERSVVLVLDDLQWADPSTLDLLNLLIATPTRARMLVLGSYRHDEVSADQRSRLAPVVQRAEHLQISGLTVEEVEELVGSISGPDVAAELAPELHRRTGGHPLFVSELARLPDVGRGGALPTAVSEAVASRLRLLPEATRTLLDAASVLGNRLLPDVLAAVTDQRPPDVIEGLEAALDAGIVTAESPADIWFAHDLFRETLYEELRASRRMALHAAVGSALADRAERGAAAAGDVARHLTLSASLGEPDVAIHWAREAAADERRRSGFVEAAAHLRRIRAAIASAGWNLGSEVVVALMMEEADDRARSGDPDQSRELLSQAAAFAETAEQAAEVALAVQRLGAKFGARRDEVIAQLEEARAGVAGRHPILEAQTTAALARELQHSVEDDRLRAGPLSERAIELGRASDDDGTLIACLLARHDALWKPGTGEERAELGREIATLATRMGDTDRLAEGLILEANGLIESGSPRFRNVLDRWFALMEQRDEAHDRYMVLTRRACVALIEGRRKDAEALMNDAAALGEQIHEPDTGNVFMSQRVALAQAMDDPEELRALAEDAVAWWTGVPILAHAVAAGAYAAAGDLEAAEREVDNVAAAGGYQSEGSYMRSVLVGHLAEAASILGDTELCRDLRVELEGLAGSCGMNGAVVAFAGPFAHPAAILAGALGDDERASELFDLSIATARRLGAHVWVRRSEEAALVQRSLQGAGQKDASSSHVATLERTGRIWTVSYGGESGSVNHVKGLVDILELVRRPGVEITALSLAGGAVTDAAREGVVDQQALDSYRLRLEEIDTELDDADRDADVGRAERLTDEREQLLEELRRTTGIGGRVRTDAGAPAEKARKAVSARLRDAINRLEGVVPSLAAHLDRSVRTGIRCIYDPAPDEPAIDWRIQE